MLNKSGRVRGMAMVVLGAAALWAGSAWAAGERVLQPVPAQFSAAEQAEHRSLLAAIGDGGARALSGRVPYHQDGKTRWMYVVRPEGRVAVGDAAELELVSAPGLLTTAVAKSRTVVGFGEDVGADDARARLGAMGVAGNVTPVEYMKGVYVIETASALASFDVADVLVRAPGVRFAHPDFVMAMTRGDGGRQIPRAGVGLEGAVGRGGPPVAAAPGPFEVRSTVPPNAVVTSGSAVNLGKTPKGTPVQQQFDFKNTGSDPVTTIAVTAPAGFTATGLPATLNPGATATLTITALATAVGTQSGTVQVTSNIATAFTLNVSVTTSALQVTGPAPALTVVGSPQIIDLGSSPINTPIVASFSLTNLDSAPVQNIAVQISGPPLAIQTQAATSLVGSAATTFEIRVTPTATGAATGTVTVASGDPGSPFTFTLSVTGTDPATPNDPLFGGQWHLNNTSMNNNGGVVGIDVNARAAWVAQPILGAGAIVAVADDGSQPDHPDYVDNVLNLPLSNYWSSTDAMNRGDGSHGTAVAGLVAAKDNSIGVRGVAPKAKLILTNVFRNGAGQPSLTTEQATQISGAVTNGAMVHTNSWGYIDPAVLPDVVRTAIINGYTTGRSGKGTLFLFAAGNGTSEELRGQPVEHGSSLASMKESVAIGAISSQGRKTSYANFGPKLELTGPSKDLGRPNALGISTTDATGNAGYVAGASPGADYTPALGTGSFGGTSAATPIVAGVAALVFAENPTLYAAQVRRILQKTAVRATRSNQTLVSIDETSFGFDPLTRRGDTYGYGLVDVAAAVAAARLSVDDGKTWPAPPADLGFSLTPTTTRLSWANPPADATGEYAKTMVVRFESAANNWLPTDGVVYNEGTETETGAKIVRVASGITSYIDTAPTSGVLSSASYAVFIVNSANRYSFPQTVKVNPRESSPVLAIGDTDTMETANEGVDGWIPNGDWRRSVPGLVLGPSFAFSPAYSGGNCYLTNGSGDFFAGAPAVHTLLSPLIDLTSSNPRIGNQGVRGASVSWWEQLDIWGHGMDTVTVDLVDGVTLQPLQNIAPLSAKPSGLVYGWKQRFYDLRSHIGRKIRVRFTISTSVNRGLSGWYIDDFRVGATLTGQPPVIPGRPRRITLPIFFFTDLGLPISQPQELPEGVFYSVEDVTALLRGYGSKVDEPGFRFELDFDRDGTLGFTDLATLIDALSTRPALN